MYVCAPCACSAYRGQERAMEFLRLDTDGCELLGIEPRYSGRVANALNHGAISPALNLLFCFVLF